MFPSLVLRAAERFNVSLYIFIGIYFPFSSFGFKYVSTGSSGDSGLPSGGSGGSIGGRAPSGGPTPTRGGSHDNCRRRLDLS